MADFNKNNYLAERSICTGCMACVDTCTHSAISAIFDECGHLYPYINPLKCVDCGLCASICPVKKTITPNAFAKFNAAWSLDDDLRKKSATAGIFASLAKYVINNGGYVAGAIMSNYEVKHIITNDLSQLPLLQGSKYQQGNLAGIYKEVKAYISKGVDVLFSGVPCQIAALKSYLKKDYNNLYTIDLICGGFPSSLPIQKFKLKYPDIIEITSFRDKEHGWRSNGFQYRLKARNTQGQIIDFGYRNLPILAFGNSMTHRKSCLNCQFAKLKRCSDITIGDLWGDQLYQNQHHDGVSVVITHSLKGEKLLTSSNIKLMPTKKIDVIQYNLALINGVKYTYYHFARFFMFHIYNNLSYDSIVNLYLGKGILGFFSRINSYIISKIKKYKKTKILKSYSNETDL